MQSHLTSGQQRRKSKESICDWFIHVEPLDSACWSFELFCWVSSKDSLALCIIVQKHIRVSLHNDVMVGTDADCLWFKSKSRSVARLKPVSSVQYKTKSAFHEVDHRATARLELEVFNKLILYNTDEFGKLFHFFLSNTQNVPCKKGSTIEWIREKSWAEVKCLNAFHCKGQLDLRCWTEYGS